MTSQGNPSAKLFELIFKLYHYHTVGTVLI